MLKELYSVNNTKRNARIIWVIVLYLVLGIIWIMFSDKAVQYIIPDEGFLIIFRIVKELLFILVTTIIFFYLLNYYLQSINFYRSELKTTQEQSERKIRLFSRAVEQSPTSIVITDNEGIIEYVNKSFVEKTGFKEEEAIGKKPSILKSGAQSVEFYAQLWNTILSGNEWKGELLNKRKDGTLFWEAASIYPIRDSLQKITHFIAIKVDITEQKLINEELINAKQRAEESDKLKSIFLAQMSHEIRTPLNIILSYNSFIREELEEYLDEEKKNAFNAVKSAGKRLLRTIDLILNMSEIQASKIIIKQTEVDLDLLLRALCEEFQYPAKEKNIILNYLAVTDDSSLISDEYILQEIFQNLIDNALKYTDQGKIDISLDRDEDNRLIAVVSDTGIGISDEFIQKLFLPFSQEDTGYTRRFEGNGLGLALVKNYLDLLNADIKVVSKKEIGTKFLITFK